MGEAAAIVHVLGDSPLIRHLRSQVGVIPVVGCKPEPQMASRQDPVVAVCGFVFFERGGGLWP